MMSLCSVRFLLRVLFPFWVFFLQGREFLYPVAVVESEDRNPQLYFLYQKSIMQLELWIWNSKTKEACKGLPSLYSPAGLKILQDKSGFSFIDNGRLRIKLFKKRSPRSLEMNEPLYNMSDIEWIDSDRFFLGAKKGNHYGIFQVNMQGDVKTVIAQDGADCMYPQKVGDKLFYIERLGSPQNHQIVCIPYPTIKHKEHNFNDTQQFEVQVAALIFDDENTACSVIKNRERELVYESGHCPIIFLHMVSKEEGFYIEHPGSIDRQDKVVTFRYHRIKKEEEGWTSSFLFSFSIPSCLIVPSSDFRLHESIFPLIPRHKGKNIYFSDCSARQDGQGVDIFCYSLPNGQAKRLSVGVGEEQFFSPLFVGNRVFYGGSLAQGESPFSFFARQNACSFTTATV